MFEWHTAFLWWFHFFSYETFLPRPKANNGCVCWCWQGCNVALNRTPHVMNNVSTTDEVGQAIYYVFIQMIQSPQGQSPPPQTWGWQRKEKKSVFFVFCFNTNLLFLLPSLFSLSEYLSLCSTAESISVRDLSGVIKVSGCWTKCTLHLRSHSRP